MAQRALLRCRCNMRSSPPHQASSLGRRRASSKERVMAPRPVRPVRISSSWRQGQTLAGHWVRPASQSRVRVRGRAQTRDAGFMMSSLSMPPLHACFVAKVCPLTTSFVAECGKGSPCQGKQRTEEEGAEQNRGAGKRLASPHRPGSGEGRCWGRRMAAPANSRVRICVPCRPCCPRGPAFWPSASGLPCWRGAARGRSG